MRKLFDDLISSLPEADVSRVLIGLHWTAAVVKRPDGLICGLSSTICNPHAHHGNPDMPLAGQLENYSGKALARLAYSGAPVEASVGMAAINALLPKDPRVWYDFNAEEVISKHGQGQKVALIGHFPFVNRLRERVGELFVIEQNPQPGDFPASSAGDLLPRVQVAAITGTSLINHTLEELLSHIPPSALVILLGPSTPLSPILYKYGIDILCGSVVASIDPVLKVVEQGGNFRQVRRAGVRTVTMAQPGFL